MRFFIFYLLFSISSFAKVNFKTEKVAEDLGVPWGIEFIGADILTTDREGQIYLIDTKTKKKQAFKFPLPLYTDGQGGLLDVKKHPKFDENHWLYFTYSKPDKKGATTALARGTFKGNKLTDVKELFVANAHSNTDRHFGSRMAFDHEGHLFMSVGERGIRKNAQDLSVHNGKILRLDQEGKAAKGNPFENKKGALPEIWSYGHRNPQGLFFDLATKTLWEGEHGPRGGDEINRIQKGKNYGWPVVSLGQEYMLPKAVGVKNKKGMENPEKAYIPSIAPCGLLVYSGKMFPEWKGSLFQGSLVLTHLNRVEQKNGMLVSEQRLYEAEAWRVRAVVEAADGSIYFSSDDGELHRMYQ